MVGKGAYSLSDKSLKILSLFVEEIQPVVHRFRHGKLKG